MIRRQFSPEEKFLIVEEAKVNGITAASRKHQVYVKSIRDWREKLELGGTEALALKYSAKPSAEVKALLSENQRLKQIIVEKELELSVKSELLKKTLLRKAIS